MSATVPLRSRRQRSGVLSQPDQVVYEFQRDPEVPRRFTVPVPLVNERSGLRA
ncbi:MAG: hypothetical protein ACK5II_01975 [Paracoccus sp. (in: a-proteobacteria)]